MGGKEYSQVDSQYYEKPSFNMNILVCGDYCEDLIQKDLENLKIIQGKETFKYIKKGQHKNIPDWKYFFFEKNKDIGKNTLYFIRNKISQKDADYKNMILFYSGLNNYSYKDLLKFYDQQASNYHINTLIITKKNEEFVMPGLKKMNKDFIRTVEEDKFVEQLINIIEITSYCNELGDEIGFPKKFVSEQLVDKDCHLMIKDSFCFNILVCGRPGSGKSLLINRILGKLKCFSGKGQSSLTMHVVKYIHDSLPLVLYDTPGFEYDSDIERVQKLLQEKNTNLNEEKNRIHCVFYCVNTCNERTFREREILFLKWILDQKMDIFFIATHAGTKDKSQDFLEAARISLFQNSGEDNRIKELGEYLYPVELLDEEEYKKFGLKELFLDLYEKYKEQKIEREIKKTNLNIIQSSFFGEINTKENVKKRLTALARRVKTNFKILASSMGQTPSVQGTTMLSTSVIKIISKIYNQPKNTSECLKYIESKNYTNELTGTDTSTRKFEKTLAFLFYKNGPAAKEVDYLSESLIEEYNKEMENDRTFYDYLNSYRNGINEAIESLKKIND